MRAAKNETKLASCSRFGAVGRKKTIKNKFCNIIGRFVTNVIVMGSDKIGSKVVNFYESIFCYDRD